MPEMRRHGYSEELAAGSIGVGATLDILIPPSIAMVIYGIATQTSIGKLLVAGVIPGIIVGILLAVMIYIWVWFSPQPRAGDIPHAAAERRASLLRVWPSLLLIGLVLIMLYTGIATPTEIGALGAARCHHWRGVRPPHRAGGDRRAEADHPHLGDDLHDPDRRDRVRLLHDA